MNPEPLSSWPTDQQFAPVGMHAVEDWAGCRNSMIAAAEAKLEWKSAACANATACNSDFHK
jgi:hypothetical protein